MADITVSYDPYLEVPGWNSFWSFIPDWMIGMGSTFYTWKAGSLYKHDSNTSRNTFYGTAYSSTITAIFNQEPLSTKVFKTISIDGSEPWDVDISSDLEVGGVASDYFIDKEGDWYAHIRRDNNIVDLKSISTQGIGKLTSIALNVLTFDFRINSSISIGDKLYKVSAGALVAIGTVFSYTAKTITVSGLVSAPVANNTIVFTKNSQAESYGVRGYYMEVTLSNDSTSDVELFSIGSSAFKSNL